MVRDRIKLSTFLFSGVTDAEVRLDVREYAVVHSCLRALMAVVVAVTVAVGGTSGPSASEAGVTLALSLIPGRLPRFIRWR